jgi:hypothetical protein
MKTHITTWKVHPIAWLPISAAIVAETVSNGLRAYGLGTHLEKFTITAYGASVSLAGAVLVLAAVAVSLSQARAAWLALMPGAPVRQRIVAGLAAVLLLGVSVTAMVTHLWEADRAKVGSDTAQTVDYRNAKRAFDDVAGQVDALKRFGPKNDSLPRPREAVQAEIEAKKIDWGIWSRSKKCQDITKQESKDECGKVLPLYEEQGAYASLILLEPKLTDAKAKLETIPKPIETVTSFEETVLKWWALAMGLAVVFIATFGAVIWAKPTSATQLTTAAITNEIKAVTDGSDVALVRQQVGTGVGDVGQSDFDANGEEVDPRWFSDEPVDPKPRKRKPSTRAKRKDDVIAKIRAHTLKHGAPPTFKVVKARHRLSNGSAHRYLRAATAKLALVN